MSTQQNQLKYPNVFIQSHSKEHLRAIYREAERAGYVISPANKIERIEKIIQARFNRGTLVDVVVHLESSGSMWVYSCPEYNVDYWVEQGKRYSSIYSGAKFVHLRKLRGIVDSYRTVESQDKQSELVVRPKHSVINTLVHPYVDPDSYMYDCDNCYHSTLPKARKACQSTALYGGKCMLKRYNDPSMPELAQELFPRNVGAKVVYEVKPNLIGRITRSLVLAGSKVVAVFASVIKFLRGSK